MGAAAAGGGALAAGGGHGRGRSWAVVAVTLWQLHLNLLLTNTTTTGGDTGAHYMMPAYLQLQPLPPPHRLEPRAGTTATRSTPSTSCCPTCWWPLASHVIPYNVAFKLATVLGSLLLPVAAWALGRLFGLRPPAPAALAAATLPFLFDYTFTIYGGNLFSTLAGEYAYSLSVALALLFLGLFARGIRTGRHRGWAAVVLARVRPGPHRPGHVRPGRGGAARPRRSSCPSAGGSTTTCAGRRRPSPGRRVARACGAGGPSVWWGASTVGLGLLLSGWWLVPFGIRQPYSTTMNYANVTTYATLLFPRADLWALCLAGVAVVVALALRSRFGLLFAVLGGLSALALIVDPLSSLYNVRFLPLWFLCVYLMAGWIVAVCVAAVARWSRRERATRWALSVRAPGGARRRVQPPPATTVPGIRRRPRAARWAPGAVVGPLLCLAGVVLVVVPPFVPPWPARCPTSGSPRARTR